jgi:hypothetical protein
LVLVVFWLTQRLNKVIPFTVVVPKLAPVLANVKLDNGAAFTTTVLLVEFDNPFGFVTVNVTVVPTEGSVY